MNHKILIVDDSKLARMAVSKALGGLYPEWTQLSAANADEAVKLAPSADLALVDFNMPGKDGLALAADLLGLKPGMPLAIISANQQKEIVDRVRDLGATFLSKPLAPQAFAGFLEAAVRSLKDNAP